MNSIHFIITKTAQKMKLNPTSAYKRPVYGLSQVSVYFVFQNVRDPWMKKPSPDQTQDKGFRTTERSAKTKTITVLKHP